MFARTGRADAGSGGVLGRLPSALVRAGKGVATCRFASGAACGLPEQVVRGRRIGAPVVLHKKDMHDTQPQAGCTPTV
jgi:hypothetical protein